MPCYQNMLAQSHINYLMARTGVYRNVLEGLHKGALNKAHANKKVKVRNHRHFIATLKMMSDANPSSIEGKMEGLTYMEVAQKLLGDSLTQAGVEAKLEEEAQKMGFSEEMAEAIYQMLIKPFPYSTRERKEKDEELRRERERERERERRREEEQRKRQEVSERIRRQREELLAHKGPLLEQIADVIRVKDMSRRALEGYLRAIYIAIEGLGEVSSEDVGVMLYHWIQGNLISVDEVGEKKGELEASGIEIHQLKLSIDSIKGVLALNTGTKFLEQAMGLWPVFTVGAIGPDMLRAHKAVDVWNKRHFLAVLFERERKMREVSEKTYRQIAEKLAAGANVDTFLENISENVKINRRGS